MFAALAPSENGAMQRDRQVIGRALAEATAIVIVTAVAATWWKLGPTRIDFSSMEELDNLIYEAGSTEPWRKPGADPDQSITP